MVVSPDRNSDGSVPQGETFEVSASVQVKNERTGQSCYISSFEFLEQCSIFQAEVYLHAVMEVHRTGRASQSTTSFCAF